MGKYAYWTERELNVLRQLIDLGCTLEEMCSVFPGRSLESVRLKARKLGYRFSQQAPEIDEKQLRALIALRKG